MTQPPSTYQETVDFLFSQLPMFQRQGKSAFKKDLTNIIALCEHLGNPQSKLRFIHIAGTNGKGSTAHILGALLGQQYSKVGIYTSPHFRDYRERIKIGGNYIPEQDVIAFVQENHKAILDIRPSFFEITVAMAFWYFQKEKVDIVVLETGLGGRLDSTNIVAPELSVITNIGFDHMEFLGDTLQEIAREKAGIIKEKTPIVIGKHQRETEAVFDQVAQSKEAPQYYAEDIIHLSLIQKSNNIAQYKVEDHAYLNTTFKTNLVADVQGENIRTALAAHKIFSLKDEAPPLTHDQFRNAMLDIQGDLKMRGRWQVLNTTPLTIADGAHNQEGISLLLEEVAQHNYNDLHIVFGMVKDKQADQVISILPKEALYYTCAAQIPRALSVEALTQQLRSAGLNCIPCKSVSAAISTATQKAKKGDMILCTGSMYVIAEIV